MTTREVIRPTAVFVGAGASLPVAPGARVQVLGSTSGRVTAVRAANGVVGYIPTADLATGLSGLSGLGDLIGCGCGSLGDAATPDDTVGINLGGILRTMLKLAVPVVVIGAGVALGHRWARERNKKRNGRRRRRNPPYRVKGITKSKAAAMKAYAALPDGYRSVVDINRRKGRSGAYGTREVIVMSGRP